MAHPKIKRALISVYDKTGIVEFARALVDEFGIEIISTGGTAKHLKENGIPVTLVEDITGFPEMLDGRVKTLHPKIHAAILADRDNPEHMRQLAEQGIKPIDMVVVNLYPFEKTIADPNCTFEQAIEMIDIGGPCMLRAAAKNHKHVVVVSDNLFEFVLIRIRSIDDWDLRDLCESGAELAFANTARYDMGVSSWLDARFNNDGIAKSRFLELFSWGPLRYGENPHQAAELLQPHGAIRTEATVICANVEDYKELDVSYNNYADAHAAMELCKELSRRSGSAKILFAPRDDAGGVEPGPRFPPIEIDHLSRRNLPHWQIAGATYHVTFSSAIGDLEPKERDIVFEAIKHWDGTKIDLHAVAVMPDHVHILVTPRDSVDEPKAKENLSAWLQSIKAYSGREISKLRGGIGKVWVRESFDRWIRGDEDFIEKYNYIARNPLKEGLSETPEQYPWWYGFVAMPGDPKYFPNTREEDLRGTLDRGARETGRKEDLCAPRTGDHRMGVPNIGDSKKLCTSTSICSFIKHTNACGVGTDANPKEAYRLAYTGDPNAAMGGVLACSFDINREFAATVMDTYATLGKEAGASGFFVEVWIAPSFQEDAIEYIRTAKPWGKRVRLLAVGDMTKPADPDEKEYKSITGGMLVQTRDLVGLNEDQWKIVTKRAPTEAEMADLRLAWLIAKHTKSNAISICKDGMLIGNGAGQMSRVMSCRIATWLAKENRHEDKLKGSVAASDAFFPFPDGPTILMDAGVTAIIQPGGSKNDDKVIAACDERGVAMIFTGTRHFRH